MSKTARAPETPNSHHAEREFGAAMLVRMFVLHQRLCSGTQVTAVDLARELAVNERTIRRYLETMRDQLGAPVDRDASGRTYYYTRTCDFLPMVKFAQGEAFAVASAVYAFAAAEGASANLASAMEKLTPLVGGIVSFPLEELGRVVSAPATDGEFRHAELLMHAALHCRELSVKYQRPTPGAGSKTHTLHPLHLAPLDHRWVLIAREGEKGRIKNFLFSRMQEIAATGKTFERPADFDAKAYLAGSIGRFAGRNDLEARIAFTAEVAGYARENFRRHASAQWASRLDGRTELTLRLNNLVDIKNAVLRYGEHAEVLAPPELRAQVSASLKAALAQYA